jgi:adenosylcobyric acid synthase
MGHLECAPAEAAFAVVERTGRGEGGLDGVVGGNGAIVGTMLHGLFENEPLRAGCLRYLRERRGLSAPPSAAPIPSKAGEYDRLARAVREHVDMSRLAGLVSRVAVPG